MILILTVPLQPLRRGVLFLPPALHNRVAEFVRPLKTPQIQNRSLMSCDNKKPAEQVSPHFCIFKNPNSSHLTPPEYFNAVLCSSDEMEPNANVLPALNWFKRRHEYLQILFHSVPFLVFVSSSCWLFFQKRNNELESSNNHSGLIFKNEKGHVSCMRLVNAFGSQNFIRICFIQSRALLSQPGILEIVCRDKPADHRGRDSPPQANMAQLRSGYC